MKRAAAFPLLLVFALSAGAATRKPVTAEEKKDTEQFLTTPGDLDAKIKRSIDLGVALYLQDKASAIGTDLMLAKLKTPEGHGLGGYLTLQDGDEHGNLLPSWMVTFYSDDETPLVKYRAHVPMGAGKTPEFETIDPPRPFPEAALALIRARQAAIKAAGPFSQPINAVILPAGEFGEGNDILIELLAGTKRPDTVVLGKHFRVIVSGDGKQVKSVTALSKGPLELNTKEHGNPVEALMTTQIVTDYPLETHVFASMLSKLPLYVGTSRGIWLVDRDSIKLLPKTQ
jgi:hypothetical protein